MTLEIITCDSLLPNKHGFFTRRGGASSGIFKGLNCGFGSSDQTDIVAINRAAVADALDVASDALMSVHQIHSADVVEVKGPGSDRPKGDAMVTATPGVALGILTADCAPLLFIDHDARVIGAAHAGWQGALGGVAEATLNAMVKLGASIENTAVTIGPCISQRNYEVGLEFFENFISEDAEYARFFGNGANDKFHFDLPSFCLSKLRNAGVASATWTGHCTYAEPDRFYSYRRATHLKEPDYGRLISAITL